MGEDIALISVGTSKDQAISSILRLYEKMGIRSFILAGTSSSTFPTKNDLMGLADVNIKEVINNLSPSDMESNVKLLQEKLGQYDVKVVDITGGTKAIATSLAIYSTQRNLPIVYLEGPGVFSSYYPNVPRPLQSFKAYGKIVENHTPLKLALTEEQFQTFDINKLAYYFNLITKEGDHRVGVYIDDIVDSVNLSSDDAAFQFSEEILNKVRSNKKPSFDINTVRRVTGLDGFDINLKGKNYIFLDTNMFYNIPSEVLHALSDEKGGFFVLDCVQAELHHKCVTEKKDEACFAWWNFHRLKGIVSVRDSGNKPGYLQGKEIREKEERTKENKCDTEEALYFMGLPPYVADSAIFLTFDYRLAQNTPSKNVKLLNLNNTTQWKIRGIGFLSFFRLLTIFGYYYDVKLRGANGTLHIKTEGTNTKVSVSQQ